MQSLVLERKQITFSYTDSGPGSLKDDKYRTLVIIHGHTFHSGTFQRLLPLAESRSLRLICVNRRDYPGTTPFSSYEVKIAQEGSDSECAAFLHEQGIDLALFVDCLIEKCSIPERDGITLVAWSLGNTFLLSLLNSMESLPAETQQRLKAYVKGVILWDPPSMAFGIEDPPGGYVPLYDESLPPEARGPAFGTWVSSYWTHGDLSTHDPSQLNYRTPDPSKKATTDTMTLDELSSLADFGPGDRTETILARPSFVPVLRSQMEKALFDVDIRKAWGGLSICHLMGSATTWNVHFAQWALQDKVNAYMPEGASQTQPPLIVFKIYQGANHYPMWDEPERCIDVLEECLKF